MALVTGTAGAAGYGTVDEDATAIMSGMATAVYVKCLAFSANDLLLNIPLLHGSCWLLLKPGDSFPGRFGESSWGRQPMAVNVKALDNTAVASLSWGVSAKL